MTWVIKRSIPWNDVNIELKVEMKGRLKWNEEGMECAGAWVKYIQNIIASFEVYGRLSLKFYRWSGGLHRYQHLHPVVHFAYPYPVSRTCHIPPSRDLVWYHTWCAGFRYVLLYILPHFIRSFVRSFGFVWFGFIFFAQNRFRFDYFLRSCSADALGKRCEALMKAAEKEDAEWHKRYGTVR